MIIQCDITGATKETKPGKDGPKLPRGWKRFNGKVYSAEAWKARFVLRAVTLPIVSPGVPWKDFDADMKECWKRSTQLANWAVQELMKADVVRDDTMAKLPAMPHVYLYGMRDFAGWSQSAACILRSAELKYRKTRYDRIWLGRVRLPDTRYPYPYPIHNQGYRIEWRENVPFICVTLNGKRYELRLGTKGFSRQMRILRAIEKGEAIQGEAAILKSRGAHPQTMLKIVAWIPRPTDVQRRGELIVKADSQSFLVCLNENQDKLWMINGDRMRVHQAKHYKGQQRFREDQKHELRWPKRKSDKFRRDQVEKVRKYQSRLKSFVEETVAHVVAYGNRTKSARVRYYDDCRSYWIDFPWHEFKQALQIKCDEYGIEFVYASDEVNKKTRRPLATTGKGD